MSLIVSLHESITVVEERYRTNAAEIEKENHPIRRATRSHDDCVPLPDLLPCSACKTRRDSQDLLTSHSQEGIDRPILVRRNIVSELEY